ncbi:hypothetical protein FHJ30_20155 [Arthrobacter sp. BB-1]|uniref:hypothetical protein n=1 Tax=unclassified Arthrobacter TaxID=235627 RepID=UPI0011128FED|nr:MULTISPECIES: hypothetical protein [unclassified Arthrobacter]TNB67767.1 hypothetical protein FHJ30_20155 [Arthrobacter sp. BB-1]
MALSRSQSQDFLTRSKLPVRLLVALVLMGHGLIHVMGFVLFLRMGEPGDLRYTGALPEPGTLTGTAAGILWFAAAGVFLASAVLLLAARPFWRCLTLAGVTVSVPLVALNLHMALAGFIVDVVLLALIVAAHFFTAHVGRPAGVSR